MMDWHDHIHSEPHILGGKPVFAGTRISVERVLKLMGAGWTETAIAEEFQGISRVHFQAAAAFAADLIHDESYVAAYRARAA